MHEDYDRINNSHHLPVGGHGLVERISLPWNDRNNRVPLPVSLKPDHWQIHAGHGNFRNRSSVRAHGRIFDYIFVLSPNGNRSIV